jgi:sulfite reductase alpha subunit-like flavoprotein
MAFGNSSFENHCRFGRQVDEILKAGGGQQLIPVTLCDSKSPERSVTAKFPEWSKLLVEILNSKNSLKEVPQSSIGSPYTVSL